MQRARWIFGGSVWPGRVGAIGLPVSCVVAASSCGASDAPVAGQTTEVEASSLGREDVPPAASATSLSAPVERDREPGDEGETSLRDLWLGATRAVLVDHCGACHGAAARSAGTVQGDFDAVDDLEGLFSRGLLVAGYPERSPLFVGILDGLMPPVEVERRPSDQEVQLLWSFVALYPSGLWGAGCDESTNPYCAAGR